MSRTGHSRAMTKLLLRHSTAFATLVRAHHSGHGQATAYGCGTTLSQGRCGVPKGENGRVEWPQHPGQVRPGSDSTLVFWHESRFALAMVTLAVFSRSHGSRAGQRALRRTRTHHSANGLALWPHALPSLACSRCAHRVRVTRSGAGALAICKQNFSSAREKKTARTCFTVDGSRSNEKFCKMYGSIRSAWAAMMQPLSPPPPHAGPVFTIIRGLECHSQYSSSDSSICKKRGKFDLGSLVSPPSIHSTQLTTPCGGHNPSCVLLCAGVCLSPLRAPLLSE